KIRVAAGQSATEVVTLRAMHPVNDGKLRIDAESDAIERKVNVHPSHRPAVTTSSGMLSDSLAMRLELPTDILGAPTAELKLFPSPVAHVIDSIAGGLRRPYGCAEQTTSSTYPNLLLLRILKSSGVADHPRRAEAMRNLADGFVRLKGYRGPDGSYTYWGKGPGDAHLTAYVLRFLIEARDFANVEQGAIEETGRWLAAKMPGG